jgi:hypothetical protein
MTPGFETGLASTTDTRRLRVTRAGTLKNMFVMQNGPSTSANNVVYTLLVNGVATALTVTIAGNVATGSDTTHTVAVAQGDQLTIQITKAVAVSPAITNVLVTVEFQ